MTMGNSGSKKARLEQLEKDCAQTNSDLATRDQELARAQKGLEASQEKQRALSTEADNWQKKCSELDSLSKTLEAEREKQIAKLQDNLRSKTEEAIASRRVVESRTQERDDFRRQTDQMQEKVQLLEQKSQMSTAEFEQRRKELEDNAESRSKELEEAKAASAALADQVKLLEQRHADLSLEFDSAQSQAEAKLVAAQAAAEQQLSTSRTQASEELALAKSSMSDSARILTSVSSELASTKAALAAATTKLDTLTLTHNESVTRRTASYEAFTATKQELLDVQKGFLELNRAHEDLKRENQGISLALKVEKEAKEALMVELAALRKLKLEAEARKGLSEVQVQEVRLGGQVHVEAAAA